MRENYVIFIPPVLKICKERNALTKVVTFENSVIKIVHYAMFYYNLEFRCKIKGTFADGAHSDRKIYIFNRIPKFLSKILSTNCFFSLLLVLRHSIVKAHYYN